VCAQNDKLALSGFISARLRPKPQREHLVLVDNSDSIMSLVELPYGPFLAAERHTFISRF
jgi:hypothetical protein